MKISFVLPGFSYGPVGGYKVAYEYANQLARRGHEVTLLHPWVAEPAPSLWRAFQRWRDRRRSMRAPREWIRWFSIDPAVKVVVQDRPRPECFPQADATIATAWRTAEWVAAAPAQVRGRGMYLIQHFEDWDGDRERVLATWKLPLEKIVISRWLGAIASELGETSVHIPNGMDFREFGLDEPIEARNPSQVVMLWHDLEWKGSREGLAALEIARRSHPGLRAAFFGTGAPPADLPEWVAYHRDPPRPALRALYNASAIFLGPSHAEGWPLPPAEAMTCGCAPVLTEIGGHVEYAEHERNALLAPARDPEALAAGLVRLLSEPDHRKTLARQAVEDIHKFTWDRATDSLEGLLDRKASPAG